MSAIAVNARFLTRRITGLERYAIEVSRWIKRLRPDCQFIAPAGIIHQGIARELGTEVWGDLRPGLLGYTWDVMELPTYLRRRGSPHLLTLTNIGPLNYRHQTVVIHDVWYIRHPEWCAPVPRMLFTTWTRAMVRCVERIVTDSEFSKTELCELLALPAGKVSVARCGASPFPEGETAEATANPYGDYILTVGSTEPRKNLTTLYRAFHKLAMPGVKLVIVTYRNQMGKIALEPLLSANPDVVCTDYLTDGQLANLYRHARLFVYPSLYEGFGMPPLEAMAAGCPVIVSDRASLPEICGDAAVYTDASDAMALAATIRGVLDGSIPDRRDRHAAQLARFRWQDTASVLLQGL